MGGELICHAVTDVLLELQAVIEIQFFRQILPQSHGRRELEDHHGSRPRNFTGNAMRSPRGQS
jgi:hypothetical protein